jgi:UPF0271 protein
MACKKKGQILIIDSAAVLNDPNFFFSRDSRNLITNTVLAELRDSQSKALAENALKNNLLEISTPSEAAIEQVREKASALGMCRLSLADLSVIALAMELRQQKPIVLTDDYSIQNILKFIGIEFRPVIQPGIDEIRKNKSPDSA